jgi:hypothetical protein
MAAVAGILCSGGVESMTRDDGSVTAHDADLQTHLNRREDWNGG